MSFDILDNYFISKEGQNNQLFIPLLYHCQWVKLDEPLQIILAHDSSHSRKKRSYIELLFRIREHRDIFKRTLRTMTFVNESDFNELMLEVDYSYRWDFIGIWAAKFRISRLFNFLKRILD